MTPADRMVPSVEDARRWYANRGERPAIVGRHCTLCNRFAHEFDAASLALDLAIAAAHPAVREPSWRTVVEDVAY